MILFTLVWSTENHCTAGKAKENQWYSQFTVRQRQPGFIHPYSG